MFLMLEPQATGNLGERPLGIKRHVHEYVVLDGGLEPPQLACADCGRALCAWDANYREHATVAEEPIEALGPLFGPFAATLDEPLVHRVYACPGCGRRLDSEVCP